MIYEYEIHFNVGLETPTAVTENCALFWDMNSMLFARNPATFRRNVLPSFSGWKISQGINQKEADVKREFWQHISMYTYAYILVYSICAIEPVHITAVWPAIRCMT
jgi:hypothetical protein